MRLDQLIQDIAIERQHGGLQHQVQGLAYHSGKVTEGDIFVAIKGGQVDGHDFINQAIDRCAHAIVVEKQLDAVPGVTILTVANTRVALARIANRFYGFPSHDLTVVGITGTNGKTTTTYLLESIFQTGGQQVGVIGTVNMRYPGKIYPAPVTTPESLDLQRILREMLDAGVTHVLMEVSSHGLDMHRVDETRFAVGLFTNLSQDHLDYHSSLDNYFAAKSKLFSKLLGQQQTSAALAVINGDDTWGQKLCSSVGGPLLRYGLAADAEVRAEEMSCTSSGISALFHTPKGEVKIRSPLLGRLNLYNLLAATAVAVGLDLPLEEIRNGQESLTSIPGRLESVPNDFGFQVVVDYAHTPDALEKALDSLKELLFQSIICVFGCGGDRDRSKRPLMGEIAARRADLVVVTSDNPRSEKPEAILADIEEGIRLQGLPRLSSLIEGGENSPSGYILVVDRSEAITLAINCAVEGDAVYIGGKGHENYQILGDRRIDFDDRVVATEALEERKRREDTKQ
jgi:UDP-N-acetylmuramoyl-L-alanyl-D-glutamate--2,6-diaminopimelate ligase